MSVAHCSTCRFMGNLGHCGSPIKCAGLSEWRGPIVDPAASAGRGLTVTVTDFRVGSTPPEVLTRREENSTVVEVIIPDAPELITIGPICTLNDPVTNCHRSIGFPDICRHSDGNCRWFEEG